MTSRGQAPGSGSGRQLSQVRRQAPEPWATAMRGAGMVTRGQPSLRELARRVDQVASQPVEREAVRAWVLGDRTGAMPTYIAQGLSAALGVPVRDVLAWAGSPVHWEGAWTPPPEAASLTAAQRRVVNQLIRMLAAGNGHQVPEASVVTERDHLGGTIETVDGDA